MTHSQGCVTVVIAIRLRPSIAESRASGSHGEGGRPTGSVIKPILTKLGPKWRFRLRRLNRFRFVGKHRAFRRTGTSPRERPMLYLRYLLFDSELDNYTFDLADEDELARAVAEAVDASPVRIRELFDELRTDARFDSDVRARTRGRLDVKRRPPLGRRLGWYALVRELRPQLVVECGVQDGIGSTVLLRALERNVEEGAPGRLLSFDAMPGAGWMVPDRLRQHWQLVTAYIERPTLDSVLAGKEVGLVIEDTGAGHDVERLSYEGALEHAAHRLVLVSASAQVSSALKDLADERSLPYRQVAGRPKDHFHPGIPTGLCTFHRAS